MKLKYLFLTAIAISLLSCAGYFGPQDTDQNSRSLAPLALSGGGFLSSDTANDISPFVFRLGGKTWLFFSSDRGGNYDIYYAEKLADGTFTAPVKMDTNINSSSNEYCPVVYLGDMLMGFTNTNLTIVRQSGSSTNIITYRLSSVFPNPEVQVHSLNTNASAISKVGDALIATTGSSAVLRIFNVGSTDVAWGTFASLNAGIPVHSAGGYKYGMFEIYILSSTNLQFSGFMYYPQTNGLTPFATPLYNSPHHDKTPYVDPDDSYKVYFASDRHGLGNFDLYRYNWVTFDLFAPYP